MADHAVPMTDLMSHVGKSHIPRFIEKGLISDGAVPAEHTDPNLVNPWGISFSSSSPFWISENGQGVSSVDSVGPGNSVTLNVRDPVTIPSPTGDTSAPTGQVFNSFQQTNPPSFVLSDGQPATFMFATEDGTIAGWNPNLPDPNTAELKVDNSTNTAFGDPAIGPDAGAVYKGLALGTSADGSPVLYAANFRSGKVDMYDAKFNYVTSFTDPTIPSGFAPFNVQVLNGKLYVTYAEQDDMKHDDVKGLGNGFVDTFNADGSNSVRIASHGNLNSPWGLTIAPSSFGKIAGDLLVGNFGDGHINVFDQNNTSLGQLAGPNGDTIAIDGLWDITPGNGGTAGDPNKLYFSAGINDEQDGLFGSLSPIPKMNA